MFWTTDSLASAISAASRARSTQSSQSFFALPSTLTETTVGGTRHSIYEARSPRWTLRLVQPVRTDADFLVYNGRSLLLQRDALADLAQDADPRQLALILPRLAADRDRSIAGLRRVFRAAGAACEQRQPRTRYPDRSTPM